MTVDKIHNMEAPVVDIKVYVPLLKGGRCGLPNGRFRMQLLDSAPRSIANTVTVSNR